MKYLSLFLCILIYLPSDAFAYEVPTHQSITRAAAETYQNATGKQLTSWEVEAIVEGSADEDDDWRFMRHFYDPIHQIGLKGAYPTSKEWATSTVLQAAGCINAQNFAIAGCASYDGALFESPTDDSWNSAVFTYSHKGEIDGLRKLGHTIHLLQDATVPAHVRNDAHPSHEILWQKRGNGDYYEHYSSRYSGNDVAASATRNLPVFNSVNHAFDITAFYTNTNYYSRNQIETFRRPDSLHPILEKFNGVSFELNSSKRKIAQTYGNFNPSIGFVYFREIDVPAVMSDHWADLSQRAVLASAGAMDLFFREVAKEKQTLALLKENEFSKRNIAQKTLDSILSAFNSPKNTQIASVASAFDDTPVVFDIVSPEENTTQVTLEPLPVAQEATGESRADSEENNPDWTSIPENNPTYIIQNNPVVVSVPVAGTAPGGVETPSLPQPIILTGGAGQGGGGVSTSEPSLPVLTPLTCVPPEVINGDSTACAIPDTTPPTLTATLSGCLSLAASETTVSCLVHTSSVPTLSWVAEAGSAVSLNGTVITDTSVPLATSAILKAVDAAGNVTTKNITITSDSTPLLISEVGYPLDTPQDTAHQYVELYNATNTVLDINSLRLESSRTEGDPALPQFSLPLAGTIQPHSYFLITNDFDIVDTVEDMTTAWLNGLTNTSSLSHQLLLKQGTAVLDSYELSCPTLSTTCHTSGHPFALERSIRRGSTIDYAYSLEQNNTQFVFTSGTTRFVGTPGRRNTADYVVSTLSDTLSTEYSPYYIHALEVPAGAMGAIDAGVILTMRSGGGIHINGTLIINGTATNPVLITSTDRWGGFTITAGGNLSATYTTVSNAGIGNPGSDTGAIKNRGGAVTLSDVLMTDVQPNGFFQDDGSATLTNVSITTTTYPENAVKVRGGTFIFNGGTLSNFSDFGFHITGTPMCTISNIAVTGVRSARTSGSDMLCAWDAVTHNGSPL